MAFWFGDTFDHYTQDTFGTPGTQNTAVDILRKWTAANSISWGTADYISQFVARQQPGQGLRLSSSNCSLYKTRPGAAVDTLGIGAAVMFESLPSTGSGFLILFDGASEQVSVRGDGAGHITFNRGSTVLATSTNVVSINTWYWIELKAKINNTTGTYEVRVNGTATGWIPAATGANTRSTANNQATGSGIGSGGTGDVRFDDVVMWDTTGSTNNDFLGPQMGYCSRPAGAGNYAQWTPNFGSNDANVGEIFPDGDMSFNQSSTANQIDSFVMTDPPLTAGTVTAIQHVLYAKQDAGAQRQLAPLQRSGGVDYVGTTVNLGTSYGYYLEPKDVDPATSAAFTVANIKAAEFGYKLIA